jgi:polyisoprenoid-binding protein YceI
MKVRIILLAFAVMTALTCQDTFAQAAKVKSFKMTVKGTSTLHEWESVVEKLECKANYKVEQNALTDMKDVVVKIPVTSIKSPKGKMMDSKTYDAFNYEVNPTISFTLLTTKINASAMTADLKGTLSMAGESRPVELQIIYKVLPGGELLVSGSKKIRMKDFKMESPTAMMGTIKVGDEVTVTFEITLTGNNTIL